MSGSKTSNVFRIRGGCLWFVIGVLLALAVLILLIPLAALNRTSNVNERQVIELIVLPFSTYTPTPGLEDLETPEEETPEGTPTPGVVVYFSMGELVEIFGTEGDGLRLRNAPGLDSTINELALENEVFEVHGGPEEVDGYIWWFLINPYDNTIQGWGVGSYLRSLGR